MALSIPDAVQSYLSGSPSVAMATCQAFLLDNPGDPDALHLLAVIQCDRGDPEHALLLLGEFLQAEDAEPSYHNTQARALMLLDRPDEAKAAYGRAWTLRPNSPVIANNIGCLCRNQGDLASALTWFRTAAALDPDTVEIATNLAVALAARGDFDGSLQQFRHALRLNPHSPDTYNKCGAMFLAWGRMDRAEQMYRQSLALRPDDAETLNNLAVSLMEQNRNDAALDCLAQAIRLDPGCADAHYNLGCLLLLENRQDEARDSHERALAAAPLNGLALWGRCMVELPVLYDTPDQVCVQRARYERELAKLEVASDHPACAAALAAAASSSRPFFLPFQGLDDRNLQARYGQLITRILRQTNSNIAHLPGDRIRIGIVSGFFCEHTIWRLMLKGWLGQLDRSKFEITAYYTGVSEDGQTDMARSLSPRFIKGDAALLRDLILADQPHVLLYPEIGIDRGAALLASHRLAPVQCVSWGHPYTTGLPTMDIFLSSMLMEPEGAAASYTERLIQLPNIGIYYDADERQATACTRREFALRDTATLFWCGQAVYKYLPDYDDILVRIALGVGDCQFLFIGFARSHRVTEQLRDRLHSAFAKHGLDGSHYIVMLEPMSHERFLGSVGLADIVLDSCGWSGGKSTLDMLAQAPVIITWWGPMMRGRHTAAILTAMGITDTIATTLDEYIALAIRLAADPAGRQALATRMLAGRSRILADVTAIRELEAVLTRAVSDTFAAA